MKVLHQLQGFYLNPCARPLMGYNAGQFRPEWWGRQHFEVLFDMLSSTIRILQAGGHPTVQNPISFDESKLDG